MSGKGHPSTVAFEILRLHARALGCLTDGHLNFSHGFDPTRQNVATLNRSQPSRLYGYERLLLGVSINYRHYSGEDGSWRATVSSYVVDILQTDPETRAVRELYCYHWMPNSSSDMKEPHVHVGSGISSVKAASKTHIETGHLHLPQMLRTAIELGAVPRRDDADAVMRAVQETLADRFPFAS